ncbi:MAG: hypothetical protein WBM61_01825 [Woeseiaceae bacterium]
MPRADFEREIQDAAALYGRSIGFVGCGGLPRMFWLSQAVRTLLTSRELVDAARTADVLLVEAMWMRFQPFVRHADFQWTG